MRRQMAEAAFDPLMITSGANSSEEYELMAGPAAEGTLVVADRRFNTAESAEFEASLRATYEMEPDLRVTRGYSSAKLWVQAVDIAGTIDGAAVAQALRSGTFHVFRVGAGFDDEGKAEGPLGEPALWLWHERKPVPLPSDAPVESTSSTAPRTTSGSRIN